MIFARGDSLGSEWVNVASIVRHIAPLAAGTINPDLPDDFIDVVLSDGGITLDSVTIRSTRESASAWDGTVCAVYSIRLDEGIPTTFLENGEPGELEVVIFKPFAPGPFPTVMFNHGPTGDGSDPSLL